MWIPKLAEFGNLSMERNILWGRVFLGFGGALGRDFEKRNLSGGSFRKGKNKEKKTT